MKPFISSQQTIMGKSNIYHQPLPAYTNEILRLLSNIIYLTKPGLSLKSPGILGGTPSTPGWVWCLPMHPQHGRHDGPSAWKFPGSKNSGAGDDGGRKQQVGNDKRTLGILSYLYTGCFMIGSLYWLMEKNKLNKFLRNGKPSLFIGFFRKNIQATHCLVIELNSCICLLHYLSFARRCSAEKMNNYPQCWLIEEIYCIHLYTYM